VVALEGRGTGEASAMGEGRGRGRRREKRRDRVINGLGEKGKTVNSHSGMWTGPTMRLVAQPIRSRHEYL
jgi:hypothetical protein